MPDPTEILMPRLSDSMEEGTVISWLKQPGEEVARDEDLVEIETDKATMVFASETAGTLLKITVAAGETCAVGAPIGLIGLAGELSADEPSEPAAAEPAPAGDSRIKASPVARRIAKEHGIDLDGISGSGAGGRITKADVEALVDGPGPGPAEPTPPEPAAGSPKGAVEVISLNKLQQTVARRMAESKATVPHFYLESRIEMTAAVQARRGLKQSAAEGELVPSVNDLVVKACALALREHSRANGAYRDGAWELYSRVNVGVAVAAPGALVVPTIFDADRKSLREIAAETRRLAGRVRDGEITPPELAGGTFTVSNLGMHGIDGFAPVVNLGQAAILAVGAIRAEPTLREGELVEVERMAVTLASDHRILYGADAAQLLARIRSLLEEPLSLAL